MSRTNITRVFTLLLLAGGLFISLLLALDASAIRAEIPAVYQGDHEGSPLQSAPAVPNSPIPWTPAIPILGRSPRPTPPPSDPALPQPSRLDSTLRGAARAAALRANTQYPISQYPTSPTSWYENDTQGVRQTWETFDITGTGVRIGVLDSGVDFGNPALTGRYALQPHGPYAGWPIAFDATSMEEYILEPGRAWPNNWVHYVNASYPITGSGVFTFADPLTPADVYTVPGTSQSGRYLLGYHPDTILETLVLAADEAISGTYDAVYLDMDFDGAFETRLTKDNPVGALDLTGDGVPDSSAGLLYWIADGVRTPPGMDAVYGAGGPVPAAGTLLAFMIDDTGERGGGHGTECASTAVGNDGGIFVPTAIIASFYTTTYGPLVQGPAPGAELVPMGNIYEGGSLEAWYNFTVLGYDGVAGSGDEPHIVTLSFGEGAIDNDGWDWESRYIAYLNLAYGDDSPLYIHSAGNGGPGYGTTISPYPATALIVGASTQYGTYNRWGISETVSSPGRVNTGDVARFSGRGPGADGKGAIDLVANGRYGTGAYPLNFHSDGTLAYRNWSGTSRSGPAAGGMAALAYQGFYQAHGRYPTYQEGTGLMMNAAADLGYDPLVQGAGGANAFRATQSALGQYGVVVDPPRVDAGDFRGQQYPAFAGGLERGETETVTFTVSNLATAPVTVTLGTVQLEQIGRYTATLDTITDTATNYGHGAPDYALNLTPWITAHPDADLMVVRMTVPFEHFDTLPPTPSDLSRNWWWLVVYNWWDDGDGAWWSDLNSDGRVDWPAEIDGSDEWMRFDYSPLEATQQELRVGRPYTRSLGAGSAGIWAGATHYRHSAGDNRTTLQFEVAFYRQTPWDEVSLSMDQLLLPAGGQATFQATIQVPPDVPHGFYQGMVIVTDTGRTDLDPLYAPRKINVPFTWQVWPDVAVGATIGGTPRAGTPYDNAWMDTGFDWYRYKEAGDWRFFSFDLDDPPEGSIILAHTFWEDYPTDLDTLIFGPTPDNFSAANPDWFGPYALGWVGGSPRVGSRPRWEFGTATGGTEEWAAAPAQDGLHTLVQQAVLLGGRQTNVPFTTSLGLAYVQPYPLRVDPACGLSCPLTVTFRAELDIPDGLTDSYAFGWFTPTLQSTPLITPGHTIIHSFPLDKDTYRLEVALRHVIGADDLDLYLYDDNGTVPGAWDPADGERGRAAGPGVNKSLGVRGNLTVGQYWVLVEGQAVDPGGGSYDLEIVAPPWDSYGAMSFSGLPVQVVAGQTYTFSLQIDRSFGSGQQGLLVFGPPPLPAALEAPVFAEPLVGLWVHKSGPAEAEPGSTITFTITYGNLGPSEAHGVWLTDTLPLSVTAVGPATLYVGTLAPGAVHTWTLAAMVGMDAPVGVTLTNTALIAGQEFDPDPDDSSSEAAFKVTGVDLWVHKVGPAQVEPDGVITYTITYGSLGPSVAHGVLLTDTLPAGLTTTLPLTLNVGTLLPGATCTWTLTAMVDTGVPAGTAMTNTVRIAGDEFDPQADNNLAQTGAVVVVGYRIYLPLVLRQ